MSTEGVISLVALALTTAGGLAGSAYLWWQKRKQEAALFELRAAVSRAKAEGEVDSVKVKNDQKATDWTINKYRTIIDGYETKFETYERRIAEGMEREIRAREEAAGVRADNTNLRAENARLEKQIEVLRQRVEQLERERHC